MERDTSEISLEASSYFFKSLNLGGEIKTPLLLIYPLKDLLKEEIALPQHALTGEVEVLSVATGWRGRAVITVPGGEGEVGREVLKRRREAYLSGKPLEGRILIEGGELPIILPPAHTPPVKGFHSLIFKCARRARITGELLYSPHTATPENAALHLYTGVDLMDNLATVREVLEGYLYRGGRRVEGGEVLRLEEDELSGRLEEGTGELKRSLEGAYQEALRGDLRLAAEVDSAKSVEGSLWLRDLDEGFPEEFERRAPAGGPRRWELPLRESLRRPQVRRWAQRIKERYRPPKGKEILLLLPCSATKPYSFSPTHRLIRSALGGIAGYSRVHEVILTSPLGVVPRELEELWPASSYEVPVRGRWFQEEVELIRELLGDLLKKGRYERVFWLLPAKELYDDIEDLAEMEVIFWGEWNLSGDILKRAREVVEEALADREEIGEMVVREEITSLVFQMGEGARALGDGSRTARRRDRRELLGKEGALARFLEGRGKHYLTLKGGMRLLQAHLNGLQAPVVEIDDFHPKGKVFLQGIERAEESIRPGDEVVVVHGDEVRAVGEARLPGEELKRGVYRGMGVKVREALKG